MKNPIFAGKRYILSLLLFLLIPLTVLYADPADSKQDGVHVKGVVTDASGGTLPGVTVRVKDMSLGTVTGVDGDYNLKVSGTNPVLVFSFIGYVTQEVEVKGRPVIDIRLADDSQQLDEVVVTALGIKRSEKSLGYSVQKVGGEELNIAKGVDVVSNLNGKVAGMKIKNTTEIGEKPEILLRGEKPLIVIDGVAYANLTMNDLSSDDIENIDVLKGATASSLYGAKGQNGVIMVTTKTGKGKGIVVNVSNNTMFRAGYLKIPEAQSSYSSGNYGTLEYGSGYVWGDYMDGREVEQYDPVSKGLKVYPLLSRGENNLNDFLQSSFTTNTNVNISQSGELGSFRASATQIHHTGQWPNTKLDKFIMNVGGSIIYGKFKLDASMGYKRENSPNVPRANYGGGNYLYNMLIWTGREIGITDYKDYWKVKDQQQNWPWEGWYDNPYFLANEVINKRTSNLLNGQATATYQIMDEIKVMLRSGMDNSTIESEQRQAISYSGNQKGYYKLADEAYWSSNSDFIVDVNKKISNFTLGLILGGALDYSKGQNFWGETRDGISVPGFYSLEASNEPATVKREYTNDDIPNLGEKAIYSAYGKFSASWKDGVYLDLTGRNDWASTLSQKARSYFYPSVGLSVLPTSFYNPIPSVMDYWKVRTSWTMAKKIPAPYEINQVYKIEKNKWDGKTIATYPTTGRDANLEPETSTSFEIGTDFRFFKNRLGIDYTYFTKLYENRIVKGEFSKASGMESMFTNTNEDRVMNGMELTVNGVPVKSKNFTWDTKFNFSFWKTYYDKLDPLYSDQDPRKGVGSRVDQLYTEDWERDPSGTLVLHNGLPVKNTYKTFMGNRDPDFIAGFMNTFIYKNFSLNISIDGSFGGKMFSWTEQAMWHSGTHPDSDNQWRYDEVVNGKTNYVARGVKVTNGELVTDKYGAIISDTRTFAPNDVETSYQGYVTSYNNNAWDHYAPQNFYDATFIKLRELSFNYDLPKELLIKLRLKKLQVGIVGQNLLIWTKDMRFADPDRRTWDDGVENLNSPSQRYIGFNLNLSF